VLAAQQLRPKLQTAPLPKRARVRAANLAPVEPVEPVETAADRVAAQLATAHQFYARRAWGQAHAAFLRVDAQKRLALPDLWSLTWCCGLIGRETEMVDTLERIYQASVEAADARGAARAAFWAGYRLLPMGEASRSRTTARPVNKGVTHNRDLRSCVWPKAEPIRRQVPSGARQAMHANRFSAPSYCRSWSRSCLPQARRLMRVCARMSSVAWPKASGVSSCAHSPRMLGRESSSRRGTQEQLRFQRAPRSSRCNSWARPIQQHKRA